MTTIIRKPIPTVPRWAVATPFYVRDWSQATVVGTGSASGTSGDSGGGGAGVEYILVPFAYENGLYRHSYDTTHYLVSDSRGISVYLNHHIVARFGLDGVLKLKGQIFSLQSARNVGGAFTVRDDFTRYDAAVDHWQILTHEGYVLLAVDGSGNLRMPNIPLTVQRNMGTPPYYFNTFFLMINNPTNVCWLIYGRTVTGWFKEDDQDSISGDIIANYPVNASTVNYGTTGPVDDFADPWLSVQAGDEQILTSVTPTSGTKGTALTYLGKNFNASSSAKLGLSPTFVALTSQVLTGTTQIAGVCPLLSYDVDTVVDALVDDGASLGVQSLVFSYAVPNKASGDSAVYVELPDTNYGGSGDLAIQSLADNTVKWKSLVKFDLSGLSIPVTQALLHLYVSLVTHSGYFEVYKVGGSWAELTVTWNTAPATTGAAIAEANISVIGWIELNVTAIINDATYNANGIYLMPKIDADLKNINFGARESAYIPWLEVTA